MNQRFYSLLLSVLAALVPCHVFAQVSAVGNGEWTAQAATVWDSQRPPTEMESATIQGYEIVVDANTPDGQTASLYLTGENATATGDGARGRLEIQEGGQLTVNGTIIMQGGDGNNGNQGGLSTLIVNKGTLAVNNPIVMRDGNDNGGVAGLATFLFEGGTLAIGESFPQGENLFDNSAGPLSNIFIFGDKDEDRHLTIDVVDKVGVVLNPYVHISGSGDFTKIGDGHLTVDGGSLIHSGNTLVEKGILEITGGQWDANGHIGIFNDAKLQLDVALNAPNHHVELYDEALVTATEDVTALAVYLFDNSTWRSLLGASVTADYVIVEPGALMDIAPLGRLFVGKGMESAVVVDPTSGGNMSNVQVAGTLTFDTGAVWYINVDPNADLDRFLADGVKVASSVENLESAQAAVNDAEEQIFLKLTIAGDGLLRGSLQSQANMSDIYLSSLLMHRWNTIYTAFADRMDISVRGSSTCDPCAAVCGSRKKSTPSLWGNYVGRHNELESSFYQGESIRMVTSGVQIGGDFAPNRKTRFGAMFGYEKGKNTIRRDKVEGDDYYFGFYGTRKLGNHFDLRGVIGYGHQDYDLERNHIDDDYLRTASYGGETFEATLEVGRRFYRGRHLSFRPVFGFDFFNNDIKAAAENNEENYNAVRYGKSSLSQSFVRFGSDMRLERKRLTLNGGVYYSYQMTKNGDTLRAGVTDFYDPRLTNTLYGVDLGNSVLTLRMGGSCDLGKSWTAFATYFGDVYTDRSGSPWSHSGMIGLQRRF